MLMRMSMWGNQISGDFCRLFKWRILLQFDGLQKGHDIRLLYMLIFMSIRWQIDREVYRTFQKNFMLILKALTMHTSLCREVKPAWQRKSIKFFDIWHQCLSWLSINIHCVLGKKVALQLLSHGFPLGLWEWLDGIAYILKRWVSH